MPKPPSSVRSIRLSEEAWARLAEAAEARGMTVNAYVAELVRTARGGDDPVARPGPVAKAAAPAPKLSLPVGPARSEYGARLKKR